MGDDMKDSGTPISGSALKAKLDSVFELVAQDGCPGLVVGVAHHGVPVYRRGFGLASIEHEVANTPLTRMRIGSTSKHFTALAALLLVEEGKLDLDVGVRRYFPELPVLQFEPTLRQCMTHSSGLRCYLDIGLLANGLAILPKGAVLASLVRQSRGNFAPGEKMIYGNSGYHLLSLAIERVAEMSFADFLKARIFLPLQMADTESVQSDFEIHRGMATCHLPMPDGSWRRGMLPNEEVLGEGSIVSTVDDMLRWAAHLRGRKQVGNAATWSQMMGLTRLANGVSYPYSAGLMHEVYRGVQTIHHAGGVVGGASQLLTVPHHELDVAIHTNSALVDPVALARQVVDAVLGDAVLSPPATNASPTKYAALLGARYYDSAAGYGVAFSEVNGQLGVAVLNGAPMPVREERESLQLGAFEDWANARLTIAVPSLSGPAPAAIRLSQDGQAWTLQRLPEPTASPAEIGAPLLGRYRAADLGGDAEVFLEAGSIRLRIRGEFGTAMYGLEPFSADLLGVQGFSAPLRGVLSVRRAENRVTALILNTPRSRGLVFDRLPHIPKPA